MKVAVVYNRESRKVINLFGAPNREIIGMKTIKQIVDALKKGGHSAIAVEADKDLVDNLEEFMPRVVHGERPGMVFNVSYGLQGQARYTHVPSILEMVGIPYVASGPLAHSLALDKVVTKMILRQNGLPTPDFAVLDTPDAPVPDLTYPMIVKPKNEAVSFGLKVVNNEEELREGAAVIFQEYQQPVLVEQYIDGREVNVGLIGNGPPEALPPVELIFGEGDLPIYTLEDKKGESGRIISHECPAPLGDELLAEAQELSTKAFNVLGCYDCARVDMRLDKDNNLYILEINSLPSLGEHGSYLVGAAHVGMDFAAVINRLVEVASARYFGTPEPPQLDPKKSEASTQIFNYITQRRDRIERRVSQWVKLHSPATDPIGLQEALSKVARTMDDVGMKRVADLSDERSVGTWQTPKGFDGGTLLIAHVDVPVDSEIPTQMFRRDPEWLYGDGIGSSRAPLVMLEYVLRALKSVSQLKKLPIGVLFYNDEGRETRDSAELIRKATKMPGKVLILRPGNIGDSVFTQRRGTRRFRFRVEGAPLRPGRATKKPETLRWVWKKLEEFHQLTSQKGRVSVSAVDVKTETLPLLLPHRVTVMVTMTYPNSDVADEIEAKMREVLGKRGPKWELTRTADRPAMRERRTTTELFKSLNKVADQWDIPLRHESSVWPSVAGLVPPKTPCLCGIGPVARDLGTPNESVQRISLIQRTLMLAEFLTQKEEA